MLALIVGLLLVWVGNGAGAGTPTPELTNSAEKTVSSAQGPTKTAHLNTATVHQNTQTIHQNTATVHQNTETIHQNTATIHRNTATEHLNTPTVHKNTLTEHQNTKTESLDDLYIFFVPKATGDCGATPDSWLRKTSTVSVLEPPAGTPNGLYHVCIAQGPSVYPLDGFILKMDSGNSNILFCYGPVDSYIEETCEITEIRITQDGYPAGAKKKCTIGPSFIPECQWI